MSADTLSGPRTVPGVHGYPNGTDTRSTVTSEPSVGIRVQTVTPTEEA